MINQKAQRNMKKIIFLLIGLFSIMNANGAVADTLFFQPIYDGPGDDGGSGGGVTSEKPNGSVIIENGGTLRIKSKLRTLVKGHFKCKSGGKLIIENN